MPEKGRRTQQERSFAQAVDGLPVVVKDELPDVVAAYQAILTGNGVPKLDVRRAVERFETIVFDGDPRKTIKAVEAVGKLEENQGSLNSP